MHVHVYKDMSFATKAKKMDKNINKFFSMV